jgi:hypothetical protein
LIKRDSTGLKHARGNTEVSQAVSSDRQHQSGTEGRIHIEYWEVRDACTLLQFLIDLRDR